MLKAVLLIVLIAAAGVSPAAAGPFTLPPGAKVAEAADAKGWQANGTIGLSFVQAKARLGTVISNAGWSHLHTIELSKDRILEAWSRGAEELTVMIWRISGGRSGFSYGISGKAGSGKGVK